MESNISNLEICCLAYDKKVDLVKEKIQAEPDCVKKKDRVCFRVLLICQIRIEWHFFRSQDGRTVLHWACSSGAVDLVQYLLDVCHVRPDLPDEVTTVSFCHSVVSDA